MNSKTQYLKRKCGFALSHQNFDEWKETSLEAYKNEFWQKTIYPLNSLKIWKRFLILVKMHFFRFLSNLLSFTLVVEKNQKSVACRDMQNQ